ncbi:MAG: ion transporter [Planctomycetota bacterium]
MKKSKAKANSTETLREKIHEIIFEADTVWGLVFDVLLLIAIACSVIIVCLETVDSISEKYGRLFFWAEWIFTVLFSLEYILRLYCVQRPIRYATSFFGIVDLLAVLPTYIGALFVNAPNLAVVRAFRLLRVFRVFKLIYFMKEADDLGRAILRARAKIIVFLGVVVVAITVAGTLMYEIENWGDGRPIFLCQ